MMTLFSCQQKFQHLELNTTNKYKLTSENDLQDPSYCEAIDLFFEKGIKGTFTGKNKVKIYYKIFEQVASQKCIVISTGRTESAIKYKEMIYDLYKNGYNIYIHDHRGQGYSERMLPDSDMGYIDDFQYYIDDLKTFHNKYVLPKNYTKKYLLAHSMGGAIGITYLEQYPNDFNKAVFSSPMLAFSGYIKPLVNMLISDKPKYALGQKGFHDDEIPFEKNTLTGSQIRYKRAVDIYLKEPKARLGGVTYHWLYASCHQFEYIFDHIQNIKTPSILFSADNERIVNPKGHYNFIKKSKKLNKNFDAFLVKNAQHELYIEKDKQRIAVLNKILDFFAE